MEADGARNLIGQAVAQSGRINGVQFAIEIGIERQGAVGEVAVFQMLPEGAGRAGHQRRVEGCRNGQAQHAVPALFEQVFRFFNRYE